MKGMYLDKLKLFSKVSFIILICRLARRGRAKWLILELDKQGQRIDSALPTEPICEFEVCKF